ncbi:MAG: hypothetical protein MH252_21240 [Thermosynechococcaceae cyanobacterium MS004]|nr:hypothetical protein [Thermosynechococcaceae cyanobacterium MS004]
MNVTTAPTKWADQPPPQAPSQTHSEGIRTKGFRRSILEILKDFREPIPERFIKTKILKGNKIYFVPWYNYIKLLEYFAPGFQWEVRTHYNGDRTVVEGKLTVLALEGDFVREATGTEENDIDAWGDPSSNAEAMALRRCCAKFVITPAITTPSLAEAMALRRCCAKFGLGLYLWVK